jgi:hypothetical protein
MNTMSNENPDPPKHNWPLICGGVTAGVLVASLIVGLIALYVANFNLLEWVE